MLELDYAETVPCRPYIVRNQTEDSKGLAEQATQPARQAAPNHHASTPISKPPWTDGEGLRRAGFFGGLSMTVLFACGNYGLPSAELPREFKDSVGVHCRRCGQELGTPPVAILNGRRPMRLRASRPRWSVSKESCATGFREAGSISNKGGRLDALVDHGRDAVEH